MSFNPRTHTGCDVNQAVKNKQDKLFQSTHPHGVRQGIGEGGDLVFEFQSTHPHGVRPAELHQLTRHSRFNPRTHTGCDYIDRFFPQLVEFQSTHPHGVRPVFIHLMAFPLLFQSTHPHGVRHNWFFTLMDRIQFQSTHPHGVRPLSGHRSAAASSVSIHAPTRGATFVAIF